MPKKLWLDVFTTKAEALDFLRAMRDEYVDGRDLAPADHALMAHVLSFHPSRERKIGCGVAALFVALDPAGYGTRGFWIRRVDGTLVDFSWNECLKGTREIDKLRDAARRRVLGHTKAHEMAPACACGSSDHLQVDHVYPLSALVDDWLATRGGEIPALRDDDGAHVGDAFALDDDARDWAAYHAKRATFQTLCRSCNARKGART